MYPKLFEIPLISLPVNSYGFMVMLGFLAALMVIIPRARKDGFLPEHIMDLAIALIITGIVGARINYVIVFRHEFSWRLFHIREGIDVLGTIIGWLLPLAYFMVFMKRKDKFVVCHEGPAPAGSGVVTTDKPAAGHGGHRAGQTAQTFSLKKFLLRLVALVVVCSVVGVAIGRIVYVLRNPATDAMRLYTKYDDWGIFKIWQGGIIFYGGLIAAFLFGSLYARRRRFGMWKIADLMIPGVALGLAFGRLGCFLNGCCFGIPATDVAWSVCYPRHLNELGQVIGSPAFEYQYKNGLVAGGNTASLPVIPIQLIESLACVAIFVLLSGIWRHKMRKHLELRVNGLVVAYFGLFYSAARFVFEFWRGDNERYAGNMTFSQYVSIGVFIASFLMMCFLQHRKIVTKRETMRRWKEQGKTPA